MPPTNARDSDQSGLSVIVPNFNHAVLLPHAIRALLAQTKPADEIIIIDDGSTDDSPSVITELASQHPLIRPILLPRNQGVVACMNEGIQRARGRYLAFAASDDRVEPHFFALAVEALDNEPAAAFFCAETKLATPEGTCLGVRPIVRPSQCPRYISPIDARRILHRIDQFVATSSAVFRRDDLVAANGFDPALKSLADTHTARRLALIHGFCFAPSIVGTLTVMPSSYSRSTAHDPATVLELMARGRSAIERDHAHPEGYGELFERRWRFAACRLSLKERRNWRDYVINVGARNAVDRVALQMASGIPGAAGSYLALAWLTVRLRPYSITDICVTALRRKFRSSDARI